MRWHGPLGLVLGMACWCMPSQADLGSDVATLKQARAKQGRVVRLKPRLLERGEQLPLSIAPELLDPNDPTCATVSVLGVTDMHFVIRFSEFDPGAPSSALPESSAAGALEITRCGTAKPYLAGMVLEMRSPRGVLETLLSSGPAGAPNLVEILPARDPGTELSLGDPGERPALPPLRDRVQRLAARAQRDGAQSLEREQWRAGEDGSGAGPVSLSKGCHELTLLAEAAATAADPAVDLDLELVDGEGTRLAVDRADDADATLSWCTDEAALFELRFVGAAPGSSVTLVHARWDLPIGLPSTWGPEARARLGRLARSEHLQLARAPIYESLGVQGTTEMPFEVEPDACYTALLAPLRGEVQSLSLSALARAPGQVARGGGAAEGAAVSFCARGASHATLEVDGDGSSLAWLLAIWETGRAPLGLGAP
jgi:hypothetical protein